MTVEVRPHPLDPETTLLVPANDAVDPEVTILIPAVNESLTIGLFLEWCHEGLRRAGIVGEILIVDSSDDDTAQIAVNAGARVLHTPRRGLGRAYIDSIPFIRGRYVVMGDADCTYDFRELGLFVEAMRGGAEYAMGSRWKGSIEKGSMPALHQYFGTPFTTWILNRLYGTRFSDIHCGMRGITRDALIRMGLVSQSWEYASEMVLKSARMDLQTTEVPVTFYKDRDGRLSHHKRSGWFSPFSAAWINLRAMFVHGAEFFLLKPGMIMLAIGLVLTLPLTFGSVSVGGITFSLYWQMIGLVLATLGLQSVYFGGLARVFLDYSGTARQRWRSFFGYNRAVITSVVVTLTGVLMAGSLVVHYLGNNLTLPSTDSALDHVAITGLLLMILGFSTFCFTLLLHATDVRYGRRNDDN